MSERCEGVEISARSWESHDADGGSDRLCAACRKAASDADAAQPQSWELFCGEDGEGLFEHFYESIMQVKMCGNERIVRVRLVPDDAGLYWGWYYGHHPANRSFKGDVSMVYRHKLAVEVCFAYGTDAETKRGRGKVVRLRAELVRRLAKEEGDR